MADEDKPRSIRFPQWLWDEIDRDAQRCRRSAVKQMEAVLAAYYKGDESALNTDRLESISGRPLATSGQKIPLGNSQLPKKKTGT